MRNGWKQRIDSILIGILLTAAVSLAEGVKSEASTEALPKNSRLAIIGDSITERKIYSNYLEIYLLACEGRKDIEVFQFGRGAEIAKGFLKRMDNEISLFNPTLATLSYGMNDGNYQPYTSDIGDNYEKNMKSVVEKLKALGVARIIIGSPGAVDTTFFPPQWLKGKITPVEYNNTLRHLRDIDEELAEKLKVSFVDIHTPLMNTMSRAKKAMGEKYDVCGYDGVHPEPNGGLVMAYAFLKALGCDGNIAEITIDMDGAASATAGHRILSSRAGKVEIESAKYPFCFCFTKKAQSILPFIPFNSELNRFVLKAKNLQAAKFDVTWGTETHQFTKEQLESGVNLAAEFSKTPFDQNFMKILAAISAKQDFEVKIIKELEAKLRSAKDDVNQKNELNDFKKDLMKVYLQKDKAVKALIVPVRYSINITPVK